MNVNFDSASVNRALPQPIAAEGNAVPADGKAAGTWTARVTGSAELAKVAGEEAVDEAELTRDDPLGQLVSRAFDPVSVSLPELPIGNG